MRASRDVLFAVLECRDGRRRGIGERQPARGCTAAARENAPGTGTAEDVAIVSSVSAAP
jgi:hypothetical protein